MALVSKILESTLTAGNTSVTFTDSDIPNSLIRVFSSNSDIIPESRILSGNTLTVIYPAQSNNIDVALEIVKQGLDIVDNVLSEDTDKALSAKQGYLLSAAIGDVDDRIDNLVIPENITDLDDVSVTDIENGQVLAWNSLTEKFENVEQSGGGNSEVYSLGEVEIGKWTDDKPLYRQVVDCGNKNISTAWTTLCTILNVDRPISLEILRSEGSSYRDTLMSNGGFNAVFDNSGAVKLRYTSTYNAGSYIVIVKYTKTS